VIQLIIQGQQYFEPYPLAALPSVYL